MHFGTHVLCAPPPLWPLGWCRVDPQPRRPGDSKWDAWRSPKKARAALLSALAAERAAAVAREPLPNPMHLTSDGAGTVLAAAAEAMDGSLSGLGGGPGLGLVGQQAEEQQQQQQQQPGQHQQGQQGQEEEEIDTLVVEFVDPGVGQLAAGTIPPAFVRSVGRQQQQEEETLPARPENANQEGTQKVTARPAGWEQAGSGTEGRGNVEAQENGEGGEGEEFRQERGAQRQHGPPLRVNKQVRQLWCFRRAAMRVMLHFYSPAGHPAPGAAADPQQQQPARRRSARLQQASGLLASGGISGEASGAPAATPQAAAAAVGANGALETVGELAESGCWPASFDISVISREDVQAAAHELSAGTRAAAAARRTDVAAADALATARQLAAEEWGADPGTPPVAPAARQTPVAAAAVAAASNGVVPLALARPPQLLKKHPACTDTTPLGTEAFLAHLQSLPWYRGQAVHCERLPARAAAHAAPAAPLSAAVAAALRGRGIRQLFSHQAQAIDHLLQVPRLRPPGAAGTHEAAPGELVVHPVCG